MMPSTHFLSHLAHFSLEREMFQAQLVEKIKTKILCSVMFVRKSCCLWDNVEKYCRAGQSTSAHCMLVTLGYKYTHSGCI